MVLFLYILLRVVVKFKMAANRLRSCKISNAAEVVSTLPKTNRKNSKKNIESFTSGIPTPERFSFLHLATLLINPFSKMATDDSEPLDLDTRINETICAITGASEARSSQIEAVKSLVYHKKDTILVAATGYGKSAVLYAVGALTNKMTIQIVPLTKLGQNQCGEVEKKVPGSNPVFVDGDTPVKVGLWSLSFLSSQALY